MKKINHWYKYCFCNEGNMKHYIQYIKNKIVVINIIFLTGITILFGLLNLGNTLGYWLISIGSAIIIGYFYLRCNYQRNMNRLDPEVLDSLK
jgi:putative solute:sodium symporter small subunit